MATLFRVSFEPSTELAAECQYHRRGERILQRQLANYTKLEAENETHPEILCVTGFCGAAINAHRQLLFAAAVHKSAKNHEMRILHLFGLLFRILIYFWGREVLLSGPS